MTRAADVVDFWSAAGFARWFGKDADFDAEFRRRFLAAHEAAAGGALDGWAETPDGALALVILLDQFPRNAFRDTARMFATDAKARAIADAAIAAGHDRHIDEALRLFLYLPYEHSERMADQERAVALIAPLGAELLRYAEIHRDAIARFGRFPHRNKLLGRVSTSEELAFLAAGGFAG
jgi:uncharacterized protein (DUF924 family)